MTGRSYNFWIQIKLRQIAVATRQTIPTVCTWLSHYHCKHVLAGQTMAWPISTFTWRHVTIGLTVQPNNIWAISSVTAGYGEHATLRLNNAAGWCRCCACWYATQAVWLEKRWSIPQEARHTGVVAANCVQAPDIQLLISITQSITYNRLLLYTYLCTKLTGIYAGDGINEQFFQLLIIGISLKNMLINYNYDEQFSNSSEI